MKKKLDLELIAFETEKAFERWLSKNHAVSPGIWLRFFKKKSGKKTIVYAEALDVALCYGWIDAVANSYDEKSYIQRFTPRRKQSIWSKRNTEHIARLEKLGRMKPSGIKAIEAAKSDGRWERAYDSPSNMTIPEDFVLRLLKNKKAKEFYDSLNKVNLYAIAWRIQTAKKPETREKRIKKILEMLSNKMKFH